MSNYPLVDLMAQALHPNPDSEDEATAYACLRGVEEWLTSPEVFQTALSAVDLAMRPTGSLSYGDTIRTVLTAVATATRVPVVEAAREAAASLPTEPADERARAGAAS